MSPPSQNHPDAPWYTYLTIDLLASVLNRSIFHPYIASLLPLCILALGKPYIHPHFIYTCIYASLVYILALLSRLNTWLAYGASRTLDWENEVVVITGGSGGLGRIVAEMFGMMGLSVAVLDVRELEGQSESEALRRVKFYCCDVGDVVAVERARRQIVKDLGVPTILINNAVTVNPGPLLSLTDEALQQNLSTNLLSNFHTLHAFLPTMLALRSGGTIVTIASVLGKLGCSNLSAYTATKAAQIALHRSLCTELASPAAPSGANRIRMILVTPGQLATPLFAGVKTPSPFLAPVVEPVELAKEIVGMIVGGASGEISLPLYARWIEWISVLPIGMQKVIRGWAGLDDAMEGLRRKREAVL